MDSSLLGLVEMILVLGAVLALAIVELLSLRREKRRKPRADILPASGADSPESSSDSANVRER